MSARKNKKTKLPVLGQTGTLTCDNCGHTIEKAKLKEWLGEPCPACHKSEIFSFEDFIAAILIDTLVRNGGIKLGFSVDTKAVKKTTKQLAEIIDKIVAKRK